MAMKKEKDKLMIEFAKYEREAIKKKYLDKYYAKYSKKRSTGIHRKKYRGKKKVLLNEINKNNPKSR